MAAKRLPLTVIGGFLGAGKTTLLNRWLRESSGIRMAVLVNDFGAINIDAERVAANSGDTIALTNGCVCCQIGDDLTGALIRVLDAEPPFDAVVIEASGVSDPWRIAQIGRAAPEFLLDGVIVLVDAGAAVAQSHDPLLADTLERQLRSADLIVANHCDQASDEQRAQLRTWIASVAGGTPVYETTQAAVPLAMLSGLAMPEPAVLHSPGPNSAHHDHGHHDHGHDEHGHGDPAHGSQFDTWSCRPGRIFALADLRAWLAAPPTGVLRLKGVVRTASLGSEPGWSELQFAGRHGSMRAMGAPANGAVLVAIGLHGQLPTAALSAMFDKSG